MRSARALLVLVPIALACATRAPVSQGTCARNPLLGTWRVVSFEDRASPEQDWVLGFGGRPAGYLIYTQSCHVTLQITGPRQQNDAMVSSDLSHGYFAYFGNYRIAGDGRTVTHRIEGALQPNRDDEARPFVLRGDTLILGDGRTWRRTFVRLR
jgi:hypothetical protein